MKDPISITGLASVSALGHDLKTIWQQYQSDKPKTQFQEFDSISTLVAALDTNTKKQISQLRQENNIYQNLDNSVLYGLYASRQAYRMAKWTAQDHFGINIGSSRGATALFENYHAEYLKNGKAEVLSSPTTTLGNISSWIANDLQTQGPEISHSITCSTGLHAVLNGVAWLQSGLTNKFLVGGSEAPLTPFTVAQMKALKIYVQARQVTTETYPCQALDLTKEKNTMFLGEGAAIACLEVGIKENARALITDIGYATEPLKHNISISANADCFQKSMKMAIRDISTHEVDIIVMHAPGTIKGDQSEYNAIQKVFGKEHPALTTNKWQLGHTFAPSGNLSLELAVLMLQHQQFIPVPYADPRITHSLSGSSPIRKVLVNAVGFGGNAVSILIEKP